MGSRLEQNSNSVRKRIDNHSFDDEEGEEYESSAFGGFADYFRRKKIKLQNLDSELRAASTDKPQIFKGIVAHVSGYTHPPLHVLHKELVQHGAGFLQYLDSKTMATHIIASSLPPKKAVDFNKYRIVKPAWVTDSIKAGKLLPWSDYRVIDEARQKTLKFDGGKISTQVNTTPPSLARYREQTATSFYTDQLKDFVQTIEEEQLNDSPLVASAPTLDAGLPLSMQSDEFSVIGDADMLEADTSLPTNEDPVTAHAGDPGISAAALAQSADESDTTALETGRGDENDASDLLKPMTSEEHNALLLQDPRMRKSSTANPNFIQQYYSESRLHHLSTWKAELKSKMQKLAADKGPQPKASKSKPGARRYIMHVDFDSFFCAVSLKSAPEYVDKPAVVAHGTGTGSEIASCNYPARKHGVKNGMWMKRAKDLCPDLKVLPYDFPAYEEASRLFYESILEVGGIVQSVSIDEALVDITAIVLSAVNSDGLGIDEGSIWREQEKVDEIALTLRQKVKAKTGCEVSVGIGGNILLAKVALRKAKPAGQFQIKPEAIQESLDDLQVDNLPGVARSIAGKLEEIGVKFVRDIRQVTKQRLTSALGPKTGEKLWDYSRGIDRTEVGDQPIRKSVSAEVNWGIRFINQEEAEEFVFNLCKELEKRLLNEGVKGKQMTMKIMRRALDAPLDPAKHLGHGMCDTFNKSVTFGVATHDAQRLGKESVTILRSYKFSPGDLRGLGVQMTKLEPIKALGAGMDNSQKRLSFGAFKTPDSAKKRSSDPIEETAMFEEPRGTQGRAEADDPIVDGPLTPRKPKQSVIHPALVIAKQHEKDIKARTPLNVGGTQFVMPTNPDPTVLAELPQDIRSRLMSQGRSKLESREGSPSIRSRTQSPAIQDEIPPDIDPEVFNALPEDMKAEILASYKGRAGQNARSPHKDRLAQAAKKTTPTKNRRGGLFTRTREKQADAKAKVVQTNFLSLKQGGESERDDIEDIDPDFLAELPEEVRKEVIADHRRRRAQRSGLDLKINQKFNADIDNDDDDDLLMGGQTKLQFGPRPSKVAFMGGLTTLPEIRDMLNVWFQETQDEGPHRRDVEMFEKYLTKVVTDEKDMDKVVKLVGWLQYLVSEAQDKQRGKDSWLGAIGSIKSEVQKAVKLRGLGSLNI